MAPVGEQTARGSMVCVNNSGYPASLEVGKSYEVLPDDDARPDELRVIDESGEDYLYPAAYFSSEDHVPSPEPESYEDVIREIRGFIKENEWLLDEASPLILGRIYTHGVQIFTTINEEVVDATNRAAAAKRDFAEAIRDSTVPPHRLRDLEAKEARASQVHQARMVASTELDNFLKRVQALLPEQGIDEPEQK